MKSFRDIREKINLAERALSKSETKEQERIVKGMKKSKRGFKERYGKDAESIMYATATKLAKEDIDVLMSESEELDEASSVGRANIPVVLILKRRALRIYPEGQIVALYHADKINKFVTIPFTSANEAGDIVVKD